jgi:hypothetical protein
MYEGYEEELAAVERLKKERERPRIATEKTATASQAVFAWPDTDDIMELAKHASPILFKKAVELAIKSNDPRLVRDVAVIANDRGHGKPAASMDIRGQISFVPLVIKCVSDTTSGSNGDNAKVIEGNIL